jgi:subtilisin family serine protease
MGTKKLKLVLAAVLIFVMAFGLVGQTFAIGNTWDAGNSGRYIVLLQEEAVNEMAGAHLEALGAEIIKELPEAVGYVVLLPGNLPALALENIPGLLLLEADGTVQAVKGKPPWAGPKEEAPATPWGIDQIDAELVWDTNTGFGSKVAVLDTGIDIDHPDLDVAGGYNAITNIEVAADDDNGHGTHVAGIIAALKDTGEDTGAVTGVAPDASLYAVKVLNAAGSGYVSDVVEGIYWAINNDMDVINLSLGTSIDYSILHMAVDAAYADGIVVVAAAGNEGNPPGKGDNVIYPAKYSSVIAVAATNQDDERPKWSSTGPDLELAAPGMDILSTWNDSDYESKSGTSMAAPHVSGTVALMLASGVSVYDVRSILQSTADDLGAAGWDSKYGYGLVDAEEAATGVETNP